MRLIQSLRANAGIRSDTDAWLMARAADLLANLLAAISLQSDVNESPIYTKSTGAVPAAGLVGEYRMADDGIYCLLGDNGTAAVFARRYADDDRDWIPRAEWDAMTPLAAQAVPAAGVVRAHIATLEKRIASSRELAEADPVHLGPLLAEDIAAYEAALRALQERPADAVRALVAKLRNLSRIMAGGDGTERIDTPAWKHAAEIADELESLSTAPAAPVSEEERVPVLVSDLRMLYGAVPNLPVEPEGCDNATDFFITFCNLVGALGIIDTNWRGHTV